MIGKYSDTMTFDSIMATMLANVPGSVDKREGSIIYDALAPAAAELAKMYIELDVIMDETFVDTCSLQYLMKRCNERGVTIKEATYATVQGAFTPSTLALTEGQRFACGDQYYYIKSKEADGIYTLGAETAGIAGNLTSGALLPVQTIAGLETANITALLVAGEDADDTETLRARYFASLNSQAFGGNQADYKAAVNLLDGVGGVKVIPVWNGGGTVKLVIISSAFGVPSAALIDAVQTAVDPTVNQGVGAGIAPIGHVVTVTGVAATTVNVATSITFATGWAFADAKSQIETVISAYLTELATDWENNNNTIVRIAQIENRLMDLPIIIDISGTQLNGAESNLQLDSDKIPTLGTVSSL